MDYEEVFDASFERVKCDQEGRPGFFHAFYQRFIKADPRVAKHFADTNMEKQQKMLEKSFYRLLVFYATNSTDDYLEEVAIRHSKLVLNIELELFDVWLECLIDTVRDYDPEYSDEVELSWRLLLATGIAYMKFKHDH
ncbi:globin [Motiliproteus sediminis]|uniref:globin n=1 Tax=Motiliproteus sediminis TaxID=1468178 RepID=UPI001AEFE4FD|nr:globin [Motiliproteus sediminis]